MGKDNGGGNKNHDPKTGRFIRKAGIEDLKDERLQQGEAGSLFTTIKSAIEKDDPNSPVYAMSDGSNTALLHSISDSSVEHLISTGGGLGSELLAQFIEQSKSKGINFQATPSSKSYYEYLGLDSVNAYHNKNKLYEDLRMYLINSSDFKTAANLIRTRSGRKPL